MSSSAAPVPDAPSSPPHSLPDRPRWPWRVGAEAAGVLVAAMMTAVVVAVAAGSQAWMLYTDGDSLITVLMTRSFLSGEPQDWAMSPVLFLPELVLYGALSLVTTTIRETLTLNAALNFLLLYVAIRVASGNRRRAIHPVLGAVIAFAAFCTLGVLDSAPGRVGFQPGLELATTTYYSATVIGAVLAVGMLRRAIDRDHGLSLGPLLGAALVSLVSTVSNPLYALWATIPVSAVAVLMLILRRMSLRAAAGVVISLGAGTVVGVLLRIPLSPWIVADDKNYYRPGQWVDSLAYYAGQLSMTMRTPAGAVALALTLMLWIVAGIVAVRAVRRRESPTAFLALVGFLSPVAVFAGLVVTGTEANRYLQPLAFSPLLALTALPALWTQRTRLHRLSATPLRIAAIGVFAVLLSASAVAVPSLANTMSATDDDLACTVDWVASSDRTGAGQFWTVRAPKAYADDPRRLIQVDHRLNPYTWLTNRTDMEGAQISFLVVDDRAQKFALPDGFSAASAERVECGRYTILDFWPRTLPLGKPRS